jgi:hypothetical protein
MGILFDGQPLAIVVRSPGVNDQILKLPSMPAVCSATLTPWRASLASDRPFLPGVVGHSSAVSLTST